MNGNSPIGSTSTTRLIASRLSDRFDKWLFFAAFVVGSVVIVAMKHFDLNQVAITIVPVGIMILYAVAILAGDRFLMRDETAGDSLYYLGFLYTLVSLAVALFQFSVDDGSGIEIVRNFGIALATTIVGLAGRVLLAQLRQAPAETEAITRRSLTEAARELRDELRMIINDMKVFRLEVAQQASEGVEKVTSETIARLTAAADQFSQASTSIMGRLDATFGEFGDNAKALARSSRQMVTSAEKLTARLDAIEAPPDILSAKLDKGLAAMEAAAGAIAARAQHLATAEQEAASSVKTIAGQMAELLVPLREAAKSFNTIQLQLAALSAGDQGLGAVSIFAASFKARLEEVEKALAGAVAQLPKLSGLAGEEIEIMRRHRQELEQELGKSRQIVTDMYGSIASLANLVVTKLAAGNEKPDGRL